MTKRIKKSKTLKLSAKNHRQAVMRLIEQTRFPAIQQQYAFK